MYGERRPEAAERRTHDNADRRRGDVEPGAEQPTGQRQQQRRQADPQHAAVELPVGDLDVDDLAARRRRQYVQRHEDQALAPQFAGADRHAHHGQAVFHVDDFAASVAHLRTRLSAVT